MSLPVLILLAAAATYATRVGGHLVVSRFDRLDPRVEAALDAVPAAVLTAIVVPAFVTGTWREVAALALAGLVGLRLSTPWVVGLGLLALVALRTLV